MGKIQSTATCDLLFRLYFCPKMTCDKKLCCSGYFQIQEHANTQVHEPYCYLGSYDLKLFSVSATPYTLSYLNGFSVHFKICLCKHDAIQMLACMQRCVMASHPLSMGLSTRDLGSGSDADWGS